MIPLPSELILPYAGLPRLRPEPDRAADRPAVELLDRGRSSATIGNTLGSLVAYAIGAYGGRPFLERYGKYLLIRPHEIELADAFFAKHGAATAFFGRLLPIVRTFISFPAGVARMPLGTFIVYSTAGRVPRGRCCSSTPARCSARTGSTIRARAPAVRPGDRGRRSCSLVVAVHLVAARDARAGRARGARTTRRLSAAQARRSSGGLTVRNVAVQQQVVHDLEAAGEVERQRRVARRSRSARDESDGEIAAPVVRAIAGHAGRRRALVRVDDRHHVRLARRDVHLAEAEAQRAGRRSPAAGSASAGRGSAARSTAGG